MDADKFSFPTRLRLGKPADYQKVFKKPIKSTDRFFTLLVLRNDFEFPRLGLAISKKNIRKAVARNFIKRTVRENFRLQQHQLINIDVVVLARRDAEKASSAVLKKSLNKHWLKLLKQCA